MTFPKYITLRKFNGENCLWYQTNHEETLDEGLKRNYPTTGEVKYIRADIAEQTNPTSPNNQLASALIDAWGRTHGGKAVPWRIAVQISALIHGMPDAERDRLLAMDDE